LLPKCAHQPQSLEGAVRLDGESYVRPYGGERIVQMQHLADFTVADLGHGYWTGSLVGSTMMS